MGLLVRRFHSEGGLVRRRAPPTVGLGREGNGDRVGQAGSVAIGARVAGGELRWNALPGASRAGFPDQGSPVVPCLSIRAVLLLRLSTS